MHRFDTVPLRLAAGLSEILTIVLMVGGSFGCSQLGPGTGVSSAGQEPSSSADLDSDSKVDLASKTEVASKTEASGALHKLFADSDDRALALDPLGALGRGDRRFADQFGDYISHGYQAALNAKAQEDLRRLRRIPRENLSIEERIAYDAFRYKAEVEVRRFEGGAAAILRRLPLDQLFGYHVAFPDISSGQSFAPFQTLADYRNGLKRLTGFATYLSRTQAAMEEGITTGHVLPAFVTRMVIEQVGSALEKGVDGSPFLLPTQSFPDAVEAEERPKLIAAYRAAIAATVLPAYQALHKFLQETYLPASRTGAPGLIALPQGPELYSYLIEQHTSSRLNPEEIHQLGLAEVGRIRAAMEEIKTTVGFRGSLREFFDFQRTDPQFKFASKERLLAAYEDIWSRLRPAMKELFSPEPQGAFEIRPVPEFLEQTAGGAYYNPGTPDGSRPGVFFVNTYDLPSRTSPTMETLFLHEAVPGHHLQATLAMENDSLPDFLRFGWNTAYLEGWALYAESLGPELGLFTDPYQFFGHLDLEMFRALRLVVDTGLHAQGWSREQAVLYMLANSSVSEAVIVADVDRYVVWPGQALAYKLGQLAIKDLRARAVAQLGASFDVRAFHNQLLSSGPVPIPVLEAKVEAWIGRLKAD